MNTFVELCHQPFCDAAVEKSTVVWQHLLKREKIKRKAKNKPKNI
jgi:hypothetical protein